MSFVNHIYTNLLKSFFSVSAKRSSVVLSPQQPPLVISAPLILDGDDEADESKRYYRYQRIQNIYLLLAKHCNNILLQWEKFVLLIKSKRHVISAEPLVSPCRKNSVVENETGNCRQGSLETPAKYAWMKYVVSGPLSYFEGVLYKQHTV